MIRIKTPPSLAAATLRLVGVRTSRDHASGSTSSLSVSTNVADMDLVRIVASLFKVSESAVQQEIDQMKSILGTDKAALTEGAST